MLGAGITKRQWSAAARLANSIIDGSDRPMEKVTQTASLIENLLNQLRPDQAKALGGELLTEVMARLDDLRKATEVGDDVALAKATELLDDVLAEVGQTLFKVRPDIVRPRKRKGKGKDCGCGKGKTCATKRKSKRGGADPPPPPPAVDDTPETITATPQFQEMELLQKSLYDKGDVEGAKKVGEQILATLKAEADKHAAALEGGRRKEAQLDATYLLELYMKERKGKPKKGKALQDDMMKFAESKLKEWDCGCGCQGMKQLRQLRGGALKECPPGYEEDVTGGLFCITKCPEGMRGDAAACRGCPPGWTDMGLSCFTTNGSPWAWNWDSQQQSVVWRDRMSRIDWDKTGEDVRAGLQVFFSDHGPLATAFDPQLNGVAFAFKEFGVDTKEAFESLGKRLEKGLDPTQNGIADAFKKFGDQMSVLGDDDWWRETMSDPRTYIFLVGTIASVAAMFVTGGAAAAALGALGPSLNMIADAAEGKPINPLDIAGLALAIVPAGAAALKNATTVTKPLSSAIPATEKAFMESIKAAAAAEQAAAKAAAAAGAVAKAAEESSRLARLGQTLANATTAAKGAVVKAVKKAVWDNTVLLRELYALGQQTVAVAKDPKLILRVLNLSPKVVSGSKFVPWRELSTLSKATRAAKNGALVLRKAADVTRLGLTVAQNGEVVGMWELPPGVSDATGKTIRVLNNVASLSDMTGDAFTAAEEGRKVDFIKNAYAIARKGDSDGFWDIPDVTFNPKDVDWEGNPPSVDNVVLVSTDGAEDPTETEESIDPKDLARREQNVRGTDPTAVYYQRLVALTKAWTTPWTSREVAEYSAEQRKQAKAAIVADWKETEAAALSDSRVYDFKNNVPPYEDLPTLAETQATQENASAAAKDVTDSESWYAKYGFSDWKELQLHSLAEPGIGTNCPPWDSWWDRASSLMASKGFPTGVKVTKEQYIKDTLSAWNGMYWGVNPQERPRLLRCAQAVGVTLPPAPTGSGRRKKPSTVDVKMDGTGFSEDTAYMGIDMSPLEGSGHPKSWERLYDANQADIHAKKVALVRRRAEQRTVKILPYTERPELLSDTFKVGPHGRDIHGQMAGGGAYRGAFTRGEPQSGETEEKFYYPAMAGREARGVAAAGGEYAGPTPMVSVPTLGTTLPRAAF